MAGGRWPKWASVPMWRGGHRCACAELMDPHPSSQGTARTSLWFFSFPFLPRGLSLLNLLIFQEELEIHNCFPEVFQLPCTVRLVCWPRGASDAPACHLVWRDLIPFAGALLFFHCAASASVFYLLTIEVVVFFCNTGRPPFSGLNWAVD